MADFTQELDSLIAEKKRQIEKLEMQILYAQKILSLEQNLPNPTSTKQFPDITYEHAKKDGLRDTSQTAPTLTESTANSQKQVPPTKMDSLPVSDLVLRVLKSSPGKSMRSAEIFEKLLKLREDTPRSTFDAVINRLEDSNEDVVKLSRGVYQYVPD